MAASTQSNSDKIGSPDAHAAGIDGGLNLKSDKSRLASPSTTRADNCSYFSPGTVQQLPAFTSTMPAATSHIYNLHARDTYAPSTTGDVMVHGEVADAFSNTTSPVWTHAQGQGKNTAQPIPPYTLRTRTLANKIGTTNFFASDATNVLFARQEVATSSANRRFAQGYYDGSNIYLVFGLIDGMQETGETYQVGFGAQYVEIIGLQGSSNLAIISLNGNTLNRVIIDFYGNLVSNTTALTSNCQGMVANAGTSNNTNYGAVTVPICTFHHCGVTYVGYVNNASPWSVYARPILTNATAYSIGNMSTTTAPTSYFAIASPTTHQTMPGGGTNFITVLFNGSMFIVTNPMGGPSASTFPNNAIISGPQQSPGGTWNNLATVSMAISDGGNGFTATSQFAVTAFRHQSEKVPFGSNSFGYQQIAVDSYTVKGVSGSTPSIVSNFNNVFRTPAGAALACKAFNACPPEANFAGATKAVQAYCAVRMGAFELLNVNGAFGPGNPYGQPTYFLLDHQARIVGRWLDGAAAIGSFGLIARPYDNGNLKAYPPWSLSHPLISDGTPTDMSCLDVQIPGWAQTTVLQPMGAGTTPSYVYLTPATACLSLSANASHVPAIQGGTYTVCSGPLTCVHDGRGMTEAGFHHAPFNLSPNTPTTAAAQTLGVAGTYSYVALYLWTDNNGRYHRSAPSAVANFISPAGGFVGATVTCVPPISNKPIIGGPVTIKLYRSSAGSPGVFFEVASQLVGPFAQNGTSTSYFITLTDNVFYDASIPAATVTQNSGTYLTSQPAMYANTNPQGAYTYTPSYAPPPFLWQTSTKGRTFGLAQVLGQFRIYYSSLISAALPYEWNPNNYVAVPPDMGDVRSIETIDDKVYVLGTRVNGVFSGDGPDNGYVASPGAGFSVVTPVPTPSGILGTGSPSRTPDGIVFQGGQGIQQIGRDGSVSPIGAQVEPITGRQVNNPGVVLGRATVLPALQSVVWANPQGQAIVYNYLAGKWSTWPLLSGVSVLAQRMDSTATAAIQPVVGSKFAGVATSGAQGADYGLLGAAYNPIYTGFASSATMVLETPWILPSDESGGEGVLWDVMVTGDWLGPHILQVEQGYNYVNAYQAPSQCKWPTSPAQYAFRVRPLQSSRVWAVRYRVSLLPMTTLQAGYAMANINDLVVNYGARQGTTRTGAAQSG